MNACAPGDVLEREPRVAALAELLDRRAEAGVVRRLARRSAATRPVSWTYERIQPSIDRFVYRLTRGRTTLSTWIADLPIVMLTTTGARSGEPRTQPVLGLPDGDDVVEIYPGFRHYERRAAPRRIRVLRLSPAVGDNVRGSGPKPQSPSA